MKKELPEHKRPKNNWQELGFRLFCEGWTYERIAKHSEINLSQSAVYQYSKKHNWDQLREEKNKTKLKGLTPDENALWRLKCPELQEKVFQYILVGAPLISIAELYGFTKDEFLAWLEEDDHFKRKIQQAVRKYELEMLSKIEGYGGKDWKSKQWLLENNYFLKETYKPKEQKDEGVRILIDFNRTPIQQVEDATVVTLLQDGSIVQPTAIEFQPDPAFLNTEGREIEAIKTTLVTTAEPEDALPDPIAEQLKHLDHVRALQAARARAAEQRKKELDAVLPTLAKRQQR